MEIDMIKDLLEFLAFLAFCGVICFASTIFNWLADGGFEDIWNVIVTICALWLAKKLHRQAEKTHE
jgi:hypothetical protein